MFKIFKAFCFFLAIKTVAFIPLVNSYDIDDCATVTNTQFNKKYMFCDDKETWYNSVNFCNQNGGKLLNIDSTSENNWIYNERQKYNTNSDIWVNLRTTNMIHWHWDDNKHGYINWFPGAPDGLRLVNCARLLPSSKYVNDMSCNNEYDFICEVEIKTTLTSTLTSTFTSTFTSTLTSTLTTNTQYILDNISSNIGDNNISSTNIIIILVSSALVIIVIGIIIKKQNTQDNNIKKQIDTIFHSNKQFPFIVENDFFVNNKLFINNNYDTTQTNKSFGNNEPLYEEPLYEEPLKYSLNSSTDNNELIYNNDFYSSQSNKDESNYNSITIQNMFGYLDIDQ